MDEIVFAVFVVVGVALDKRMLYHLVGVDDC